MIERQLHDELANLPVATAPASGWNDVLARAGESGRQQRRLAASVLAFAAACALALVTTPLGGAIARTLGDFSSWVQGDPGQPASTAEQQAFEDANARSWARFPGTPQLRQLAETDVGGIHYRLLGFRGGDSLCLRVVASGDASGHTQTCAPVSDLRTDTAPARVLLADWGFGKGDKERTIGFETLRSSRAQVTAGIAADGVQAVKITDPAGTQDVPVEGNSFLYVADRPDVGQRVTAIRADLGDGKAIAFPLSPAPFGLGGGFGQAKGEPGGPTAVDYQPENGTIGWLERGEERGQPLDVLPPHTLGRERADFGRVLTPDPQSRDRVVITRHQRSICSYVVIPGGGSAGGCGSARFDHGPFSFGMGVANGSQQYATLAGIASDDVARLELFTATGNQLDVPLKDNAFVMDVALARMPAKLVGYDRDGKVIGIQETGRDQGPSTVVGAPIDERHLDLADGASADLKAYATAEGGSCFYLRAKAEHGVNMGGCVPKDWTVSPIRVTSLSGPPDYFVGQVRTDIDHVIARYKDGSEATINPDEHGFVLEPAPQPGHNLLELVGVAANGNVVAHERVG